ncbi:DUF6-domain-containing protein [Trametes cingulata]|nr:DUF6-domain-containing protein [Trametes cingulata]
MSSSTRHPFHAEQTPDRVDFPDRDVALSSLREETYPPEQDALTGSREGHGSWHKLVHNVREVTKNNSGMLFVAAAQFFFALMNVWVKKLNTLAAVPALELICVRMGITWICCVAYMYIKKIPDPILGPKEVRLLLVLRGCFGFVGIFSLYYSLQYLSIADATVLQFLAPIFTAITGAVLLHEPFSWREAVAGVASMVGVILIARPEFLFGSQDEIIIPVPGADPDGTTGGDPGAGTGGGVITVTPAQRLLAVWALCQSVALVGTLGATGAYTTIRAIGHRAHALHNLVSYSTQSVIVTTVAMLALRMEFVIPTQWEWLAMLFLIGVCGFTAQVCLTTGLQRETASRGTMVIYIQIVFAVIDEFIFFHTVPPLLSVLGTAIILTSATYVAVSVFSCISHGE